MVGDRGTPEATLRRALDEMSSSLGSEAAGARRALDVGRFDGGARDELVAALRGRTGRISAILGNRWTQLQVLAALSLALVALVALLFTIVRRQVRELEARDAELEAQLREIEDREQRCARSPRASCTRSTTRSAT